MLQKIKLWFGLIVVFVSAKGMYFKQYVTWSDKTGLIAHFKAYRNNSFKILKKKIVGMH